MIGMTTAYKNAWDQKYRHTSVYWTKSLVFCNE
jgi:hypothetical protein